MPTCRSILRCCLSNSAVSFTYLQHNEIFTPHQITPQITATNVTYPHAPGGRRNAPNRHIAADYIGHQQAATTNCCCTVQHIGLRLMAAHLRFLVCAAVWGDATRCQRFNFSSSIQHVTPPVARRSTCACGQFCWIWVWRFYGDFHSPIGVIASSLMLRSCWRTDSQTDWLLKYLMLLDRRAARCQLLPQPSADGYPFLVNDLEWSRNWQVRKFIVIHGGNKLATLPTQCNGKLKFNSVSLFAAR